MDLDCPDGQYIDPTTCLCVDYVINPKTNRIVKITTPLGKELVQKYYKKKLIKVDRPGGEIYSHKKGKYIPIVFDEQTNRVKKAKLN